MGYGNEGGVDVKDGLDGAEFIDFGSLSDGVDAVANAFEGLGTTVKD